MHICQESTEINKIDKQQNNLGKLPKLITFVILSVAWGHLLFISAFFAECNSVFSTISFHMPSFTLLLPHCS